MSGLYGLILHKFENIGTLDFHRELSCSDIFFSMLITFACILTYFAGDGGILMFADISGCEVTMSLDASNRLSDIEVKHNIILNTND